MKRFLGAMLVVIFVCGLVAVAQEVSSVNVVGYTKKTLPQSNWILTCVNFTKTGGGTNTLLDVFGTDQLKQDNNPGNCDQVTLWDPDSQTYQSWAQWTDGKFYGVSGDGWGDEGNPLVPNGVAFWVAPAADASSSKVLTLMGQVVDTQTESMDIVEGYQLVAYPFSCKIALQDTDFFADGATADNNPGNCDWVTVWNGSSYQSYAVWTDGKWYEVTGEGWGDEASNELDLAQGFWYVAQTNMVWSETNKYLNSL